MTEDKLRVKKLADKYCDEHGGPPKKEESPIIGVDYAGIELRTLAWLDEVSEISLEDWASLYRATLEPKRRPETKYVETIPIPKLPPDKPWTQFNPTPKNPKRGRR